MYAFHHKLNFPFRCECGVGRKCVISEENLSMAAFIYRCVDDFNHIPTTTETSEII